MSKNLKYQLNDIVKVVLDDHEHEYSVDNESKATTPLAVEVYGKVMAENKQVIVIGNWVDNRNSDVYRILKRDIKEIKVMK